MNQKIKTSWDLSVYYSGFEDEKFLHDWNFFKKIAEKFVNIYSMENMKFHTFKDLRQFYEDFEEVLSIYENIRYYLLYRLTLDMQDEVAMQKISDIDSISESFIQKIAEIYEKIYRFSDAHFEKELWEKLKNNSIHKYRYTIRKFLDDLSFYRGADTNFFREKNVIESAIRKKVYDYELLSHKTQIFEDEEDYLTACSQILFELIVLRTDVLSYSSVKSVFESVLLEYSMNPKIIADMMKVFDESDTENSVFSAGENISDSKSIGEIIDFAQQILQEKFPKSADFFAEMINSGNIDFFPSLSKNPTSFTSVSLGKNPFICLNFHENPSDIETLFHEFGHAYQMHLSRHCTRLEFLPSPFLSEFSASFFEQILADFYKNNWEYSFLYQNFSQKIQNILLYSREIVNFESQIYSAYLGRQFHDVNSFVFWLRENDFFHRNYLGNLLVFTAPFYSASYIFAHLCAVGLFSDEKYWEKKWEIYEKIASSGASDSVESIFKNSHLDISDSFFWKNALEKIFKK